MEKNFPRSNNYSYIYKNKQTMVTKELLISFRTDFKEAVLALEDKYNITLDLKNISYTSNSFTTKLEAKVKGAELDIARTQWNNYCNKFFLRRQDFGKIIEINNKKYKIVGLKPRARKKAIIIESTNTQERFVATPNTIRNLVTLKDLIGPIEF